MGYENSANQRRNLCQCPQVVKEAAYKGLVRPVLEYGSCVWNPQGMVFQAKIDTVQNVTARFVTSNVCFEMGKMTGILEKIRWEHLKKRRRDSRLILLYKGLKGAASILTDDLIRPIKRSRNQYSLTFQTSLQELIFTRAHSSLKTSRDWNTLPDSIISSAKDAEDGVVRFTSLVRARD